MTTPRLGTASLAALVVANMIGAGVFTTSGFALADLHTPARVLAAWLVGAVLALCGAACYGALARRITASGGEYLFLARVMHPALGCVAGWVSLLAGFTGAIAFAASAFEAYLLPPAQRPAWLPDDALAVSLVLGAALVHGRATAFGAAAQNVLVALKLGVIVAFVGYAVLASDPAAWQGAALGAADGARAAPGLGAFAQTVMWVSLSYSGFNAAVYVAGEARDARRSVPRAMLLATLVVSVIYLALNAIFVLAPAPSAIGGREDVATQAAFALGGAPLALAMRLTIVLALATSVSSMVMAGPRVYARMAADGVLPRLFARGDSAPRQAVALQAALAVAVILVTGLETLLSYLGFTLAVTSALTVASLFVIARRDGVAPLRGYPWLPLGYVGATLLIAALSAWHRPLEPLAGLATGAFGLVAWRLTAGRRR
ncbi:MAG: amino acid permease [Gammaproteobacteria bacterium]